MGGGRKKGVGSGFRPLTDTEYTAKFNPPKTRGNPLTDTLHGAVGTAGAAVGAFNRLNEELTGEERDYQEKVNRVLKVDREVEQRKPLLQRLGEAAIAAPVYGLEAGFEDASTTPAPKTLREPAANLGLTLPKALGGLWEVSKTVGKGVLAAPFSAAGRVFDMPEGVTPAADDAMTEGAAAIGGTIGYPAGALGRIAGAVTNPAYIAARPGDFLLDTASVIPGRGGWTKGALSKMREARAAGEFGKATLAGASLPLAATADVLGPGGANPINAPVWALKGAGKGLRSIPGRFGDLFKSEKNLAEDRAALAQRMEKGGVPRRTIDPDAVLADMTQNPGSARAGWAAEEYAAAGKQALRESQRLERQAASLERLGTQEAVAEARKMRENAARAELAEAAEVLAKERRRAAEGRTEARGLLKQEASLTALGKRETEQEAAGLFRKQEASELADASGLLVREKEAARQARGYLKAESKVSDRERLAAEKKAGAFGSTDALLDQKAAKRAETAYRGQPLSALSTTDPVTGEPKFGRAPAREFEELRQSHEGAKVHFVNEDGKRVFTLETGPDGELTFAQKLALYEANEKYKPAHGGKVQVRVEVNPARGTMYDPAAVALANAESSDNLTSALENAHLGKIPHSRFVEIFRFAPHAKLYARGQVPGEYDLSRGLSKPADIIGKRRAKDWQETPERYEADPTTALQRSRAQGLETMRDTAAMRATQNLIKGNEVLRDQPPEPGLFGRMAQGIAAKFGRPLEDLGKGTAGDRVAAIRQESATAAPEPVAIRPAGERYLQDRMDLQREAAGVLRDIEGLGKGRAEDRIPAVRAANATTTPEPVQAPRPGGERYLNERMNLGGTAAELAATADEARARASEAAKNPKGWRPVKWSRIAEDYREGLASMLGESGVTGKHSQTVLDPKVADLIESSMGPKTRTGWGTSNWLTRGMSRFQRGMVQAQLHTTPTAGVNNTISNGVLALRVIEDDGLRTYPADYLRALKGYTGAEPLKQQATGKASIPSRIAAAVSPKLDEQVPLTGKTRREIIDMLGGEAASGVQTTNAGPLSDASAFQRATKPVRDYYDFTGKSYATGPVSDMPWKEAAIVAYLRKNPKAPLAEAVEFAKDRFLSYPDQAAKWARIASGTVAPFFNWTEVATPVVMGLPARAPKTLNAALSGEEQAERQRYVNEGLDPDREQARQPMGRQGLSYQGGGVYKDIGTTTRTQATQFLSDLIANPLREPGQAVSRAVRGTQSPPVTAAYLLLDSLLGSDPPVNPRTGKPVYLATDSIAGKVGGVGKAAFLDPLVPWNLNRAIEQSPVLWGDRVELPGGEGATTGTWAAGLFGRSSPRKQTPDQARRFLRETEDRMERKTASDKQRRLGEHPTQPERQEANRWEQERKRDLRAREREALTPVRTLRGANPR